MRRRRKAASRTVDPNKMRPGDFVVHRNHGIGRFKAMEKLAVSGDVRDYLVVQYADGLLRVAADHLGSLGRYRATSETPPQLSKMGGAAWTKAKERAKKAVRKVAMDLVKLYAERHQANGFAFPVTAPGRTNWRSRSPTNDPDQLKATADVKRDMEKPSRWTVWSAEMSASARRKWPFAPSSSDHSGETGGHAGPTTVLAQQHWRTLSERFAPYPIKVALLNRFRTASERKTILEGLKGAPSMRWSAPISCSARSRVPTTRLAGGRRGTALRCQSEGKDQGAAQGRRRPHPIGDADPQNAVHELVRRAGDEPDHHSTAAASSDQNPSGCLDPEAVRSAIRQELDRGGQVFYVVPRVEGIEDVAAGLREMLPGLKLLVAHGQMAEGELESAMVAFNAGEADVMLCTTIVESGLDIPRVNTILIEDAHRFGLAQLYQLRGRVGRSGIQAHAWLFYPGNGSLSDNARQRLRAIQEFAQLGSGYQLAMRDMEIRGVGNLLGVEQSGQMETIGFDLYMEMLQESLAEIQGQDIPSVDDTQVDLPVTAFVPADWITDPDEKIAAYRAAADCRSSEALVELAAGWADRYGALPAAVQSLLQLMELKLLAKRCGVSRIKPQKPNIVLETPMEEPAFRLLRQGLPQHLQVLDISKRQSAATQGAGTRTGSADGELEQLMEWLRLMAQIPMLTEPPERGQEEQQTERGGPAGVKAYRF